MGTIRRTRDHPRRQEGSAFRTRDRRVRPLQTKNQNVALYPLPDATHEYEIDSPSKRPAASIPLSIRAPPVSILTPRSLTEVIPYEGGPWPTFWIRNPDPISRVFEPRRHEDTKVFTKEDPLLGHDSRHRHRASFACHDEPTREFGHQRDDVSKTW